jgi:starch synthase (maltosyl-transferring)
MHKEWILPDNTLLNYNPVVIENISPQIDGGKFPVKVIVGEVFIIQADVFSNGTASLAARIFYQHESEKTWNQTYLKPTGNDCWEGQFLVEKTGKYRYFIKAWVDPIATWQAEMNRRVHQYIAVEDMLPEGLFLLEKILKQASKDDKQLIREVIRLFRDEKRAGEASQLAISFRFTEWLNRYPDTELAAESPEFNLLAYREKLGFNTWYTMYPRSAADQAGRHGTFQDVSRLLPRIAGMGFDVLHFPPIHPIGITNRKGKNGAKKQDKNDPGSPLAIGDSSGGHKAIHQALGSEEDFKDLVREAEALGIEIALDLALSFSFDHPWQQQYPDWFDMKSNDILAPSAAVPIAVPDFTTLKINADNWQCAKEEVKEIVLLWADWGVRLIRVVQPDLQPLDWWQQIIEEIRKIHPDLIFYAGTVTRPKVMHYLAKSGFGLSDSYFMWRNSRYELEQYVNELAFSEQKYFFKPIFRVNTPDLHPYNLQSGHEPQQLIRFFLAATLSGSYGIYGPVFEQLIYEAFPGKEEYWNAEKYELKHYDWEKETKITYLIGMVNKLRKENPALQQTHRIQVCAVQSDQIMAYLKIHEGNKILCVVNLDGHHRQSGMVQVPLHLIGKNPDETYTVHDLITDAKYEWKGEWNYVELDSHILPFHLLRIDEYRGVYH